MWSGGPFPHTCIGRVTGERQVQGEGDEECENRTVEREGDNGIPRFKPASETGGESERMPEKEIRKKKGEITWLAKGICIY